MDKEKEKIKYTDICARIPYGVYVFVETIPKDDCVCRLWKTDCTNADVRNKCKTYNVSLDHIKPILRPFKDMSTDEVDNLNTILQKCKMTELFASNGSDVAQIMQSLNISAMAEILDYLNSIHIDYRGLITMGIAVKTEKSIIEKYIKKDTNGN